MSIRLHVNIDHVATLRNARGTTYPDPVTAAAICELAGADGITCHLREDRRHIRDEDVRRLRASVTTLLNLEMAATEEMRAIAIALCPDVVTLVPERREERTTEGGLDVIGQESAVAPLTAELRRHGIRVSHFLAPDVTQIEAAIRMGVDQIELHTGVYCHARGEAREAVLLRLAAAARAIRSGGVAVAAGHGLTRANVLDIARLPSLEELNIGHALVADAVMMGLDRAVRDMRAAIDRGAKAAAS
jgi:pyridoxine 5-phosphate synthase